MWRQKSVFPLCYQPKYGKKLIFGTPDELRQRLIYLHKFLNIIREGYWSIIIKCYLWIFKKHKIRKRKDTGVRFLVVFMWTSAFWTQIVNVVPYCVWYPVRPRRVIFLQSFLDTVLDPKGTHYTPSQISSPNGSISSS